MVLAVSIRTDSMKIIHKHKLLAYFLFAGVATGLTQVSPENRYPTQVYYEDSTRVFWTAYPYPLGLPTMTETVRYHIVSPFSFYCDLSDTVELAFVASNGFIVCTGMLTSSTPPYFSVSYWTAGPRVQAESVPAEHFRTESDEHLNMLLIVRGRHKCLRDGMFLQKGWYLWIGEKETAKQ